jgi:hypothetical protein
MSIERIQNGPTQTADQRSIWVIFSGLMLALLIASLDQTVVATALPTIVSDLGGLSQLSWVPGRGERRRARRRSGVRSGTRRGRQSARRQGLWRDRASWCCRCHRQRGLSRHRPPRPRIADPNRAPLINKSSTGILVMPVLNGGANQVTNFYRESFAPLGLLSSDASEVRYPDPLKGERDVSFLRRESTAAS